MNPRGRDPNTKAEVERLMRCIDMAMGCLDPDSKNRDERLAWFRLYDAKMGREPRAGLDVPIEPVNRP